MPVVIILTKIWINDKLFHSLEEKMKKDIHPKYEECTVTCACGNSFKTRATQSAIDIEICSSCHPFYTGQQKYVDTEGRIEKFKKKYGYKEQ